MHQKVRPLVIHLYSDKRYGQFVSVLFSSNDYKNIINSLEKTWQKFAGEEVIDYSFLDQKLDQLYFSDQRTSKIVITFSVIAIFIACLGLLGLAAFIIEQRTKEIGIRKVLGATVFEIVVLLSKDFIKWVLIANIIAWPAAYFIMSNWLKNFAYRTNINLWFFVYREL